MKRLTEMTAEKMQEIYTNERLRNAVAYAHGHVGKPYLKALCYPEQYAVTKEQAEEAQKEIKRSKAKKLKALQKGTLLFVGMGMSYEARFENDICNHRIRTEFKNKIGKTFFVEFSSSGSSFYCSHSIDTDIEKTYRNEGIEYQSLYYNCGNLERIDFKQNFTKDNILKLVNTVFDCCYTRLEIDEYTLATEDFVCECT